MRENFFDCNGVPLAVGTRVNGTGTVTGFDGWDVSDGPGGDGPALVGVSPRVFVKYDDGTEDAYGTDCREQQWMDHDENRVCEDVEVGDEQFPPCPVCGEPNDYCPGHPDVPLVEELA